MTRPRAVSIVVAVGLVGFAVNAPAQRARESAADALLDVLVWGAEQRIDPTVYPPEVGAELERHVRRFHQYQSRRARPQQAGAFQLVYAAQVGYERRLVAVTNSPDAPMLAMEYVDALRPCYEWEGYHDCPEREAIFAIEYQRAHPHGPFSDYLPLLAAHRFVCAAEGYEYEQRPEGARRSRLAYEQAVATARGSANPLVRSAADALLARPRCFSGR